MFIHANTHEQMTLPPLDAPRVAHEDVMTSVCRQRSDRGRRRVLTHFPMTTTPTNTNSIPLEAHPEYAVKIL